MIKTIKLKVGKRVIELTEKEAKELAQDLEALGFGQQQVVAPPIVIQRDRYVPRPWEQPYWSSGTASEPLPEPLKVIC